MAKKKIDKGQKKKSLSQWGIVLCKWYLRLSGILVPLWAALVVYLTMYAYNKDGEYCYYTKDFNNYHILLDGEPCLLQWQMLWDFIFITLIWLIPWQAPGWLLLLYFKYHSQKKIGSIWNSAGREDVNEMGKEIGEAYKNKPWKKKK